jgi:hypothetical protein
MQDVWSWCGVMGLVLPALACHPPVLPPEVTALEIELKSSHRSPWRIFTDQGFDLGPYRVSHVERSGWNTKKTSGLFTTKERARAHHQFEIGMQGQSLAAKCVAQVRTKDQDVLIYETHEYTEEFTCDCGAAVKLTLTAYGDSVLSGQLTASSGPYEVKPMLAATPIAGLSVPAGYRFDAEELVAAVDMTERGRVLLAGRLSETEQLEFACAGVGLMLYDPPELE